MTSVLLAGGTGMVGGAALRLLREDPRTTRVVAPTRRPLPPHDKLLNPIMDNTEGHQDAEWWKVDAAICALGTTRAKSPTNAAYRAIDYDYALAVATRVRAGGATRFALVTAMGANARSWFRYARLKGELEEAVDRLGSPSLTIVRPGFLGGHRAEYRLLERELGAVLDVASPILPASARTSPAATVARVLVDAALAGAPGRRVVGSAEIARMAAARHRGCRWR